MGIFSYKIEHDYGLAPNPFGKYCTLAVCKPTIRNNKNLRIGDWVIGTGSKSLGNLHHLVFAMQVFGKLNFQEYWDDERFQYKNPVINGSLVQMFGDNFYHLNDKGSWIQETSAHTKEDAEQHKKNDLGGKYVLFSQKYYYFGSAAPEIPEDLWGVCSEGRNMKSKGIDPKDEEAFIEWLLYNFDEGIHGDPINWSEYSEIHNQTQLNI